MNKHPNSPQQHSPASRETAEVRDTGHNSFVPLYAEALIRHAWTNSLEGMRFIDGGGTMIAVNDAFCRQVGKSRAELEGKPYYIIYRDRAPEAEIEQFLERVRSRNVLERFEAEIPLWDGRTLQMELTNSYLERDGAVILLSIFRDITERHRQEQVVRESEARFRTLVQNSSDILCITETDGHIRYIAPAIENIAGFKPESLASSQFLDLVHPDDRIRVDEAFSHVRLFPDISMRTEYRLKRADGSDIAVEHVIANRLADPNITGIVLNVRDISARKRAEDRLKVFEQTLMSAHDLVSITDLQNNLIFVNPAFTKAYGYAAEELLGKNVSMLRSDITPSSVTSAILPDTLSYGWTGELYNKRKDGTNFPIALSASVIRNEDDTPIALVGVAQDITKRKEEEQQLADSERRFRLLVQNSTDVIAILNDHGVVTYVSPAIEHLFGIYPDEMTGRPIVDFMHPDDKKNAHQAFLRLIKEPDFVSRQNLRIRRFGGSWAHVETVATNLIDVPDIEGIVINARDITQRKVAEEALHRQTEYFQQLFHCSPEAICILDMEGTVLDINSGFTELFGYQYNQIVGRTLQEFIVPEKTIAESAEHLRIVMGGEIVQTESLRKRKDGTEIVVSILGAPIVIDNAQVGVFSIYRDITLRRQSEEALRESEERYRRFFEENLSGYYHARPDGVILSCNPAFARILGFTSPFEAMKARANRDIRTAPAWRKLVERVQIEGRLDTIEEELVHHNGSTVHVVETIIGQFDAQKNLISLRTYLFDDTKRHSLEGQLIQAQKIESIGTLAGGIAHDFNNVLSMILGGAKLVKKKAGNNPTIQKYNDIVIEAAKRGSSIAKQLLLFARTDQGQFAPVSLSHLVLETTQLLEHTLPRTIEIEPDLGEGDALLMGDAGQLQQVLMNLMLNAGDAMPQGGKITVTLRSIPYDEAAKIQPASAESSYLRLSIADNGVGMSAEVQQRIFDPFFTTKQRGKGTGLGLSIVHGIVSNHSGFINVDSNPGLGSTFTLYFPEVTALPDEETEATDDLALQGTETILFVDDEPMLRETLVSSMSDYGYTVIESRDGRDAVRLFDLHEQEIDLVITDLDMPGMTGQELCEVLRERKPGLRVIVITGYVDSFTRSSLLAHGVHLILQKPFTEDDLLKAIRNVIESE